jgi:hypothetical protein
MAVHYPLFVFEKDDCSMRIVGKPDELFLNLEEFDIQNDEYCFGMPTGRVSACDLTRERLSPLRTVRR